MGDDASDDWMIDDDVGTMIDEEEEEAEDVQKEKESSSKEAKVETEVTEKKSFSLPLDDASDDWMLEEEVGTMAEEDEEKAGSTKEGSGKGESKQTSDHLVSDKKLTVEGKEEKATVLEEKKPIEKGEPQSQKKSKKNKNKKK